MRDFQPIVDELTDGLTGMAKAESALLVAIGGDADPKKLESIISRVNKLDASPDLEMKELAQQEFPKAIMAKELKGHAAVEDRIAELLTEAARLAKAQASAGAAALDTDASTFKAPGEK